MKKYTLELKGSPLFEFSEEAQRTAFINALKKKYPKVRIKTGMKYY